jgi:hypothetical protein
VCTLYWAPAADPLDPAIFTDTDGDGIVDGADPDDDDDGHLDGAGAFVFLFMCEKQRR